jgi:hypothetical protein
MSRAEWGRMLSDFLGYLHPGEDGVFCLRQGFCEFLFQAKQKLKFADFIRS